MENFPPPPPPVLRRQTRAMCEACGTPRERYGTGYICRTCGHDQQTHAGFALEPPHVPAPAPEPAPAPAPAPAPEPEPEEEKYYHEQVGGNEDLLTILSTLKVKELSSLARKHKIKGRSKMNKNALINSLYDYLSN
jgi:hypothetical protein